MNHWSDEYFLQKPKSIGHYDVWPEATKELTRGQFLEVKRLAIQFKLDHARQELRSEFAKLPRFGRWLAAKFCPAIFSDL